MNLLNKLTIKNLKLNKKRTVVTITGIMLSVALITAVASMYASGIKSLIDYETKLKGKTFIQFFIMFLLVIWINLKIIGILKH